MTRYLFSTFFIFMAFALQAQNLTIEFDNIRNNEGEMSITIYDSKDTWLDDELDAYKFDFSKEAVTDHKFTVNIPLDKPGTYAIAVLDDEDANGKMRHNFIGYPREGFGFSNNVHVWLSRPKFDECVLDIKNDTIIRIHMQYK